MRIWDRNGDEDEDGPQERPNYARKATRALHAFRRTDATRCGSGVDGTARRPQEHGTKGREGAGEEGSAAHAAGRGGGEAALRGGRGGGEAAPERTGGSMEWTRAKRRVRARARAHDV
ncbi:unnamed protein product [Prorocentrum cordatum]|uniref:Uncharacterized protein n=1 Tax=Prorocentrum cordatum TaxID=2364126 RepID=A0ABN9T2G7_9DINO|nr:unnamed protein product [Polarella glacialis]